MDKTCAIIGCEMLEDEVLYAYEKTNCSWPIVWIPRKYHERPERLKQELQKAIDQLQEYDRLLLTFGCCGGGVDGLNSQTSELVFLGCEDCIHMLLYSKEEQKSQAKKGTIYLTNGWTKDEQSIVQQYRYSLKKYGEKMCASIMKMMYGNFSELSVIDTKAYPLEETLAYARTAAKVTGLKKSVCSGNTDLLEDLFLGKQITPMVWYQPKEMVKKEDFSEEVKQCEGERMD